VVIVQIRNLVDHATNKKVSISISNQSVRFSAIGRLIDSLSTAFTVVTVLYHQQFMDEFPKIFIVGVDNVGSKQMQQIRQSLRGKAEILMGKNTMIRKAIRGHLENNPNMERWVAH